MQPDSKKAPKTTAWPQSTLTLGALRTFESADWAALRRTIMAIVHRKAAGCAQKADIEDITQGLLVRLSRMMHSVEFAGPTGQRPLLPYLRVAAANALKDFWRTRDRMRVIPQDDKFLEFAMELSWEHKEGSRTDLSWVNNAFHSLAQSDRSLVDPEEYKASVLSPSEAPCKKTANRHYKRCHDARKRLKSLLIQNSKQAGIHIRGYSIYAQTQSQCAFDNS